MTDVTIGAIFDDVQEGLQALQQHIDSLRDNKWFDAANQVQSLREENRQLKSQLAALKPATESPNPERSQLEALGRPRLEWKCGPDYSLVLVDSSGVVQGSVELDAVGRFTWADRLSTRRGWHCNPAEAQAKCWDVVLARLEGK